MRVFKFKRVIFNKILGHGLIYALGPQAPKIASIIILPILTLYLTSEDYGIFGTILAYNGMLAGLKSLGLEVLLVNTFFKYPNRWKIKWQRYFGLLIVWKLVFLIPYAVFLYLIIPDYAEEQKWTIIALLVIGNTIFQHITMMGNRFYQINQKPLIVALNATIAGVLTILINLYTIAYLELGYMGWFYSSFISSMFSALYFGYFFIYKYRISPIFIFNRRTIKKELKISLPMIPHSYSSYLLNSSDRVVLDQYSINMGQIGLYNFAYVFGGYMEVFGNAMGLAVGPIMMKIFTTGKEYLIKSLVFILQILFIGLTFLIGLWMKEIIGVLSSNDELDLAYEMAVIIVMGYSYRPLYWLFANTLIFHEKTSQLWKVSLVGGVLNVVLNIVLIPFYGTYGAVFATFFGLMYIGFAGFFSKQFKKHTQENYLPILWFVIIVFSTILVYSIKDIQLFYKILITLLVISAGAILYLMNRNFLNELEE